MDHRFATAALATLLACLPAPAQDKGEKKPDTKALRKKLKSRVKAHLKARSLNKVSSLEKKTEKGDTYTTPGGVRKRGSNKYMRRVWSNKKLGKAFWAYLPPFYKSKFKSKAWLSSFNPSLWSTCAGGDLLAAEKPKIKSVEIFRGSAAVVVELTPVRKVEVTFGRGGDWRLYESTGHGIKEKFSPRTEVRGKRIELVDHWVLCEGKWCLSRFPTEKGGNGKRDEGPIAGQSICQHPWFAKGTVSVNHISALSYEFETRATVKKSGTSLQKDAERKASRLSVRKLLEAKEVADFGLVLDVKAGRDGEVKVIVDSGQEVASVRIPPEEMKTRGDFYRDLKKGAWVVYRTKVSQLRYPSFENKVTMLGTPRSDGKPSVEKAERP